MKKNIILKWLPALIMMGAIFWFSSQPVYGLPNFDWADRLVKKTGHMIGYAMLGTSYWYALGMDKKKRWLAWLLAVLYATTDEFHQNFTPGRHPSAFDVLFFDNLGALIGLWLTTRQLDRATQKKMKQENSAS